MLFQLVFFLTALVSCCWRGLGSCSLAYRSVLLSELDLVAYLPVGTSKLAGSCSLAYQTVLLSYLDLVAYLPIGTSKLPGSCSLSIGTSKLPEASGGGGGGGGGGGVEGAGAVFWLSSSLCKSALFSCKSKGESCI